MAQHKRCLVGAAAQFEKTLKQPGLRRKRIRPDIPRHPGSAERSHRVGADVPTGPHVLILSLRQKVAGVLSYVKIF